MAGSVANMVSRSTISFRQRSLRLITAGADENPDLFWGIRGGGGNFGIVTSFVFQCAEIGTEVYSGIVVKKTEDVHGKMVVVIPFVYLGDPSEGEKLIQPVRDATESHGEAIGMNPWVGWQSGFDGLLTHGARNYWKAPPAELLPAKRHLLIVVGPSCSIFIPAGRMLEH